MKRSFLSINTADSAVKRLDSRIKLLALFCASILVVLIDTAATLGTLFFLALLLHVPAGTEMSKLGMLAGLLIVALWGTILSQAIFYSGCPRTVILTIIPSDAGIPGDLTGGIYLYREGFLYGMVQGLRFLIMTIFGMLVVWTTEPQEMLLGMLRVRIPYIHAFILVTALRFVPIFLEEIQTILLAARIKKFRPLKHGVIRPVQSAMTLLNPLLANLVRKSNFLALSVASRGFSPSAAHHTRQPKVFTLGETALALGMLLMLLSIVCIKVVFLLYFHGLYYASLLRPLYSFADTYLWPLPIPIYFFL